MSGEVLVSGEICMSSKVLISGEIHISGEVNVPVYKLAVNEEYPGKAVIEKIDYDISQIDSTTLQISDWFIAEEHTPNILYKCSFLDTNKTQLRCLPGTQAVVNSEIRNYILYVRVKAMTGVGAFKVYGANIMYNGGKIDAINRTSMVKINYNPTIQCPEKVLALLINFADSGPEPFIQKQADEMLFHGQTYKFYKEQSYDKFSLEGDVFGWYKIQKKSPVNVP